MGNFYEFVFNKKDKFLISFRNILIKFILVVNYKFTQIHKDKGKKIIKFFNYYLLIRILVIVIQYVFKMLPV